MYSIPYYYLTTYYLFTYLTLNLTGVNFTIKPWHPLQSPGFFFI